MPASSVWIALCSRKTATMLKGAYGAPFGLVLKTIAYLTVTDGVVALLAHLVRCNSPGVSHSLAGQLGT
jgi:hypothetical protein